MRLGNEPAVLRLLGQLQPLSSELASHLGGRSFTGTAFDLLLEPRALDSRLQNSRSRLQYAVLLLIPELKRGCSFCCGPIQLSVIKVQISKRDMHIACPAMIVVSSVDLVCPLQVLERLIAQLRQMLAVSHLWPGLRFVKRLLFSRPRCLSIHPLA